MEAQSLPRTGRLFLPRSPKVLRALSDERLVEQVRRGNEDAFEAVYDRHHRGILAFCRHMLSSADEAEDAVQQTFISAYDALRTDAREINLKPWLYTIARNRCLSILRARREQPAEIDDVPTAGLSEEVQQRADLRELLHDLHELPVDQRAALVLSEAGGLSHAEVGAVVGCEVAKVKSLVFQARSSLIETRRAREIPCHEIREQLATLTGGALRRGPLRRHVRECAGCAEYRDEITRQRRALAAILPVVPTIGLKSSLFASIGFGGGGGGAAIGSGAAAAGGGIASLASSGAAVKLATVFVVAGVAVGGGMVVDQGSSSKQAEAAEGQGGGGQAWPAPAAATGPGARKLIRSTHPAGADRAGGARKTATPGSASKRSGGTGPGKRHLGYQPSARSGSKQRSTRRRGSVKGGPDGGRHSGGSVNTPAPTPTPTTNAPPTGSAPPATSDGDGDGRGHRGGHRGSQQGRGHEHHEQDIGGRHVPGGRTTQPHAAPPPPRDHGDEPDDGEGKSHGGSGRGGSRGDDEGDDGDHDGRKHDRVSALASSLPPGA
jgi:RNA polymerase sigma factor (sigma-70 family)